MSGDRRGGAIGELLEHGGHFEQREPTLRA
jgi:hypothetical protein